METLTKAEEKVMQIVWKQKRGFVKDFVAEMEDPKPSYNTVSTIIRILEKKGFIGHKPYGKTYEYFPLISKFAYRKYAFSKLFADYFEGSYGNVLSYLVKEEGLTPEELAELNQLIGQAEDRREKQDKQDKQEEK